MNFHFTKMEGAGNDYIYVDEFKEPIPENIKSALTQKLSNRHYGIGSDGVIFIKPSKVADVEMEMYNADGTPGGMCGNGLRCVGKYVYDRSLVKEKTFTLESSGEMKKVEVIQTNPDGSAKMLKVDMGAPILDADRIPVTHAKTRPFEGEQAVIDEPIEVQGKTYRMTCVSMGNPHAVVFVEETDSLPLAAIGPHFEHHAWFPKRTNTEFVQVLNEEHVKMRVWERGIGETMACGTGCCATAVACILNHKTGNKVQVDVLGGRILVEWDREKNTVYMTGPAEEVFSGIINIKL